MDTSAKTVDEFIARCSPNGQAALQRLRTIIHETCPAAEEKISYGIAAFKYHGMLVGFGYAKNHFSFYCMNVGVAKQFENQLKNWTVSGGTIHFTPDHELPRDTIEQIVLARMELNETKRKSKEVL